MFEADGKSRVAAHAADEVTGDDRVCVDQRVEAVAKPQLLAGLRIKAAHGAGHTQNHLGSSAEFGDDRRIPASARGPGPLDDLWRLGGSSPDFLAALLVERHEEAGDSRTE